jgi:2-polyprenyl-3-methyl-5-hydroxy-6-metoxy-1,4-benzoquinol methylase
VVGRPERRGDRVAIAGDYQFRALTDGPVVQRFWHRSKLVAIDRHLPPQPGDRVLDLGCGSGVVADHLTTASADVTTIDGNAEAIRFASMRFGPPNLTLRTGLLEDLALPAATLDRVYRLEMIEHLYRHQIHELLVNVRQILRPGGCLLLTTPNYRSPWHVVRHPA